MKVLGISLRDFRNYEELSLSFHPFLNIFYGKNAQGKTNLLEAILYAGSGKSHRATRDQEMASWGKEGFSIKALIYRDEREFQLEMESTPAGKKFSINGVPKKKMAEYLGHLLVVIFSPEDLYLVKGSPAARRRFIDYEIGQLSPVYLQLLGRYQKILYQRNIDLRAGKKDKNPGQLKIWDDQLVDMGSRIVERRTDFLRKLAPLTRLIYRRLTGGEEEFSLSYRCSFNASGNNREEVADSFREALEKTAREEKERGMTLVGPHRDDLLFHVNQIDLRLFGSQGQQRTAALALKLGEIELVHGETGEYPVLLLDDVMSELDMKRRQHLLENIEKRIQTFITTTNLTTFTKFRDSGQVWQIELGQAEAAYRHS